MIGPLHIYWSRLSPEGRVPVRSHVTDAGWDLLVSEGTVLPPGGIVNVPTGISMAIPTGWYGHLTGRSSTAKKRGLLVVDAVIDSGYRGELFFQAQNLNPAAVYVDVGQRLAQIVFLPVPQVRWTEATTLPDSSRGVHGFGSTGE